jgi:hypothetical protein
LVLGSIGSENRIYSRTLQQIKKILRLDDTDNIKKIIVNSTFPFQGKRNRLAMLWKILQPMKSTKNPT